MGRVFWDRNRRYWVSCCDKNSPVFVPATGCRANYQEGHCQRCMNNTLATNVPAEVARGSALVSGACKACTLSTRNTDCIQSTSLPPRVWPVRTNHSRIPQSYSPLNTSPDSPPKFRWESPGFDCRFDTPSSTRRNHTDPTKDYFRCLKSEYFRAMLNM